MVHNTKGLSLIEAVIAITVIAAIFLIGSLILREGIRGYLLSKETSQQALQGDIALERMIRELRSAVTFTITAANSLAFTDATGNTITYNLVGSSLMRNGQVLARSVSGLSFAYLTSSGVTTTVPAQVYYVTILITFSRAGGFFSLRSTVFSRNI